MKNICLNNWFVAVSCSPLKIFVMGDWLSAVDISLCRIFVRSPCSQVERAAEARVAREQKRAAELEEAARCIYSGHFGHADHRP